jgi:hypothetical protein
MADVFLLAFRRRSRKSEADSGYKPVPGRKWSSGNATASA